MNFLVAESLLEDSDAQSKGRSLFNLPNPIDKLLESGECTLDDLLDQDELLQEVKSLNHDLLLFLCQVDNTRKLVEYAVLPAPEGSSENRLIKYPYFACQVLCCDVDEITDIVTGKNTNYEFNSRAAVAQKKESEETSGLLSVLFSILDCPPPLDPYRAGYFEKIVAMLMAKRKKELLAFLKDGGLLLFQRFARHLASHSIAVLVRNLMQPLHLWNAEDGSSQSTALESAGFNLESLLSSYGSGLDDNFGAFPGDHNRHNVDAAAGETDQETDMHSPWTEQEQVFDLLVSKLSNDAPAECDEYTQSVHENVAEVLVDVTYIRKVDQAGRERGVPSPAVKIMERPSYVKAVVSTAIPLGQELSGDAAESAMSLQSLSSQRRSAMLSAIDVLMALLSCKVRTEYAEVGSEAVEEVVRATLDRLTQVCEVLRGGVFQSEPKRNQLHRNFKPLGLYRLKLVQLTALLAQSRYQAVDEAVADQNVLGLLVDLFFEFDQHSQLHGIVVSLLKYVLEEGSSSLRRNLFRDVGILRRIMQAYSDKESHQNGEPGVQPGYFGHLSILAGAIASAGDASEHDVGHGDVIDLLEQDPEWESWQEFVGGALAAVKKIECTPLGGSAPSMQMSSGFDVGAMGMGSAWQVSCGPDDVWGDDLNDYAAEGEHRSSEEDEDDDIQPRTSFCDDFNGPPALDDGFGDFDPRSPRDEEGEEENGVALLSTETFPENTDTGHEASENREEQNHDDNSNWANFM